MPSIKIIENQIQLLISRVYDTFSSYSIEEIKGVCTACCLYQKTIDTILSTPVMELSWDVIYDYLAAAKYDKQDLIKEAKYLLPRMIELFNCSEYIRQPSELSFETCYFNESEAWSDLEIKVVREFAELHFKKSIINNDKNSPLDELIIMWRIAGLDVSFLFDIWLEAIDYPKALDDYSGILRFDFKQFDSGCSFAPDSLANQFIDWVLSDNVLPLFLEKTHLAIQNIDTLNDWQLETYEYVLKLD